MVIGFGVILGALSATYAERHFGINSDISKLISPNLPWRQRELAFQQAFPTHIESILAVVRAPTPELASAAQKKLLDELQPETNLFRLTYAPDGGAFFDRNFLLYLSTEELGHTSQGLTTAAPLIRTFASDPNIRGLSDSLKLTVRGVETGRVSLDDLARTLNMAPDTIDDAAGWS